MVLTFSHPTVILEEKIYTMNNGMAKTTMNKAKAITFREALVILEDQFNSTYRGIKTVREMCSDLTDAMYWDKEDPNTIYHQFETKEGPNRIVKDDSIIPLALHYVPSK